MIRCWLHATRGRRFAGLIACGASMLWLAPGFAQDADGPGLDEAPDERVLEEVVVRGERWRRRERETPVWRETTEPRAPKPLHRGRMSFGYDPAEDRDLVREHAAWSIDSGSEGRQPATLFRFRF